MLKVRGFLMNAEVAVLVFIFRIMMQNKALKPGIMKRIDEWSDPVKYKGIPYFIAGDLQKELAEYTAGKICEYCTWCKKDGERHPYCEMVMFVEQLPDADLTSMYYMNYLRNEDEIFNEAYPGLTVNACLLIIEAEMSRRNIPLQYYIEDPDIPPVPKSGFLFQ